MDDTSEDRLRRHPRVRTRARARTDLPVRVHPRVRTDLPVRVTTIEPDLDPLTGRSYFRASWERCENLSRGGAFIRTNELLDPGRRVLVELSLPDGAQVEAIGRVAWTKRRLERGSAECGVGVEFLGGTTEQLRRLETLMPPGDENRH